ncbi:Ankyrin repeat and protein kinase domain-containing protein 1 [Orchesella cincta]|uniref:Ankyrin repeat and protein kinase domain-containing protein 1 n=1 Tax=Orchesella cincta TaxID=48709 RepID=A0A1D2MP59_ORCCI|nr:Ankyrin repeat and protein kinase domain-containing protein 1 [Orchesella cincta]
MKSLNFWHLQSNYLVAVQNGDVDRCKALLAGGVDADQMFKINSQNIPAICIGVERGAYALVELLLRSGVAVNSRDSRGRTSLHVAIEMGYDAICQLLLQNRADPNAADNMLISPLHLAAKRGSSSQVSSLITFGADVNRKDRSGKSPLHCACTFPAANPEVVQLLVDSGAAVNDLDLSGYSPLLCALLNSKYDIVRILINHGANVDVMAGHGNTPLHITILSNHPTKWDFLDLLLKKECNMHQCNGLGQSPIHLACLKQDIDSLRILISAGANPNTVDRLGITPLGYCISNGMEKFAHLLIDGGGIEDLDKLNLTRMSAGFRKKLLQRFRNPPSLLEQSRRSLIGHLGPYYRDWANQYRDEVPKVLHPFMGFE